MVSERFDAQRVGDGNGRREDAVLGGVGQLKIEIENIERELQRIERALPHTSPDDMPTLFDFIPLEVFGAIEIDAPKAFPNLVSWLPKMVSDEAQEAWTGSSGHVLLKQSVSFIRIVTAAYVNATGRSLKDAHVLDFGCGWGRLIRLLYKYVPANRIYGVDPMEASLQQCRDAGLRGTFFKSDYIPRALPTPAGLRFDFIFAFSVFTHLSEKVTRIALGTLAEHLSADGLLAITVRPREYWPFIAGHNKSFDEQQVADLVERHDHLGFAFAPHRGQEIEGEVIFGDTSMTLDYLRDACPRLSVTGVEWSEADPYQLIVLMKRIG